MKHKILILTFLFTLCYATFAENILRDPELLDPTKWHFTKEYKIVPNAGREGNNAIYAERFDAKEYHMSGQTIPMEMLDMQTEYEFGGQIKAQPVEGTTKAQGTLVVQFSGKGKYISEVWQHSPSELNDWTKISSTFNIPPGTDNVFFTVLIPRNVTGKVLFSNLYVKAKKLEFISGVLQPHQPQALLEGKHKFTFGCYTLSLPKELRNKQLFAKIDYRNEKNKIQSYVRPIMKERVSLLLDFMKEGEHKFKISLLNDDKETVLAESKPEIIARVHKEAPDIFVRIDERGRTWMHGKKFLPVGIYSNLEGLSKDPNPDAFISYEDFYDEFVQSPFNCFMPYDGLGWNPATYYKILDKLEKNGKKVIISFSYRHDNPERYKKIVEECRNHPAVLGWYIADETIPEKHGWLKERTEFINKHDPWHPTWAVYCLYDRGSLARYAGTANVFGIDPYPIHNAQTKEISRLQSHYYPSTIDAINVEGAYAMWTVPQWFSWALYRGDPEETRHIYRWPTEEEALTQSLIAAALGVKGFVFYSYTPMRREKNFRELQAQIYRVAESLNELAPYLLGDPEPLTLNVKEKSKSILHATFADDEGKTAIVITCDGSEAGKMIFTLPEKIELYSKYGLTKQNQKGEWICEIQGINSDILYQK